MKKTKDSKTIENLKYHSVVTTAQISASTPIFTTFELGLADMSNELSINARLLAAGLSYAGLGYAFGKFRDKSRQIFKIDQNSSEKIQLIHDSINLSAANLVLAPSFYLVAGARDVKEIAIGTSVAVGFGLTSGGLIGYSMDVYKDLFNIEKSPRIPKSVSSMQPKIKKGLGAILTAGLIGLSATMYSSNVSNTSLDLETNIQNTQIEATQQSL